MKIHFLWLCGFLSPEQKVRGKKNIYFSYMFSGKSIAMGPKSRAQNQTATCTEAQTLCMFQF